MPEITKPCIHLNGTSVETLLADNLASYRAVNAASEVILQAEFNRRDYYPVEGSWEKASAERQKILQGLRDAADYFLAIASHCDDVVSTRK